VLHGRGAAVSAVADQLKERTNGRPIQARRDAAPTPRHGGSIQVLCGVPAAKRGTDMSGTYRIERDRGIKQYRQQLAELRKKWPLAFPVHDEDIRPLAINATHEIAAVMGWSYPYTLGVLSRWKNSRFPAPWTIIEHAESFWVQDAGGQTVGWFYFRHDEETARQRVPATGPEPVARGFSTAGQAHVLFPQRGKPKLGRRTDERSQVQNRPVRELRAPFEVSWSRCVSDRTAHAAGWRRAPISKSRARRKPICAPPWNPSCRPSTVADMATRRFPPPWRADKIPGGYVVRDANGQALTYRKIEPDPMRTAMATACFCPT
jgi:hypothetical protein